MAFYKQDIVDINLNTGNIFRSFLNHSIGFKNDDADRFGIRVFRDGEPVDLTGASCQAVFINPLGTNIALTSYGTVSGNVAYVTLPQACYDYEGQFCLSIQLVGGGVTGTMRIVDGMVVNTGASGTVAPTASVPTYQEILAVYADMQEDIADYESVVANQNDQINSLKSALAYDELSLQKTNKYAGCLTEGLSHGTFDTSSDLSKDLTNVKRGRTRLFQLPTGTYRVYVNSNTYRYHIYREREGTITDLTSGWVGTKTEFSALSTDHYRVMIRTSNDADMSSYNLDGIDVVFESDSVINNRFIDIELAESYTNGNVGIPTLENIELNSFRESDFYDLNNNARGRTNVFHLYKGEYRAKLNNSNYKFILYRIRNDVSTALNDSYTQDYVYFTAESEDQYRVLIQRTDGQSMASDNLSLVQFACESMVSPVKEDTAFQLSEWIELNSFNTSTLANTTNDARGRTNIFQVLDGEYIGRLNNENYQFLVFKKTLIGGVETVVQINKYWANEQIRFTANHGDLIRVMIRRVDAGSMASDDLTKVKFEMLNDLNIRDVLLARDINAAFGIGVPLYPEREAQLIQAVKNDADASTLTMCICADNHFNSFDDKDRYQPAYANRMAYIASEIGANCIIALGDIIEGYNDYLDVASYRQQYVNSDRLEKMFRAFTHTNIPFFYVAGHHECYPISEDANAEATLNDGTPFVQNRAFGSPELKAMAYGRGTLARVDMTSGSKTGYRQNTNHVIDISDPNSNVGTLNNTGASITYYVDITVNSKTIRLLFVDGTFFTSAGYDPDTVTFVLNALTDAATHEYKVIIFNHLELRISDYTFGRENNAINESAFISAILGSGADILAYIHGHVHLDNIVTSATQRSDTGTYPYSDLTFPMIGISCQKIMGFASGYDIGNSIGYGTRSTERYNGYCYDIVNVHLDTGKINFFRFGAGDNGTYPTRSVN